MSDINNKQTRHEMLIDFLSQFEQYQFDCKPRLKKVKEQIDSSKLKDININDINGAVMVFSDTLNLGGGSIGNSDLYQLLQAYLTIPEYRDKINDVVREAKLYQYNKNKNK